MASALCPSSGRLPRSPQTPAFLHGGEPLFPCRLPASSSSHMSEGRRRLSITSTDVCTLLEMTPLPLMTEDTDYAGGGRHPRALLLANMFARADEREERARTTWLQE